MSAFIVSNDHVNTLAHAIVKKVYRWRTSPPEAIAKILMRANIRSINDHCRDRKDAFKLSDFVFAAPKKDHSALQLMNLARSFSYQACDYGGWQNSQANMMLMELVSDLVSDLPGIDEVEWTI